MRISLIPKRGYLSEDCVVAEQRKQVDSLLHAHEFSELVIVLAGSAVHMSPAGDYPITAGDVFVIHKDQAHGYRQTVDLELVNVFYSIEELPIPLLDVVALPGYHALFTLEPRFRERHSFESHLQLNSEQLDSISGLVHKMAIEHKNAAPGCKFASLAYFELIMLELCRHYSHVEDPAVQLMMRLGRVIAYISEHYADSITLDDLTRIGYMSKRTLIREFNRAMEHPPITYLIRFRINKALDLLRGNDIGITDIAFQVGFKDSNYFSKQFRAFMGCSPLEFRKRHGHLTLPDHT